jgi:hypothetical protein
MPNPEAEGESPTAFASMRSSKSSLGSLAVSCSNNQAFNIQKQQFPDYPAAG